MSQDFLLTITGLLGTVGQTRVVRGLLVTNYYLCMFNRLVLTLFLGYLEPFAFLDY